MPHETLPCHLCSSSCFGQCRWVRFSKLHCDCCVGFFIHPLNFEWKIMGWFPSSHCQDQNTKSTLLRQKRGVNDLSWHHAVLTVALTWESLAMTHRASTISNCLRSHNKTCKRGVYWYVWLSSFELLQKKLTTNTKKRFGGGEKHCQRHNGPEGWVHITSSYTNLDQISSSESRTGINFKISTKREHLN